MEGKITNEVEHLDQIVMATPTMDSVRSRSICRGGTPSLYSLRIPQWTEKGWGGRHNSCRWNPGSRLIWGAAELGAEWTAAELFGRIATGTDDTRHGVFHWTECLSRIEL